MSDSFSQEIENIEKALPSKWANKGKLFGAMLENYRKEVLRGEKIYLDFTKWLPHFGVAIGRIPAGEMFCVVSDTGGGKTVFLQQIVLKAASHLKTVFCEMELPDHSMVERFVAMKTMSNARDIEKVIMQENRPDIDEAYANMVTYSESKFSLQDLEEIVDFEKPQVLIVDYLGLVRAKGSSRYEKLGEISEELKLLANTKKIILVVSSQIRRPDKQSTGEIFLHDAKDSGSIENSAQRAIGIWREGGKGETFKIKVLKNQGLRDMIFDYKFNYETLNVWSD